ncbi:MAG: hypothetical protein ACRBFS_27040 [Aureispira sp.]
MVYYAFEGGPIRLAWNLSIATLNGQHWWSIKINAHTGALLAKADWATHCAFPHNGALSSTSCLSYPKPTPSNSSLLNT